MAAFGSAQLGHFVAQLAAKVPTHGGGAAAAVAASLGAASGSMAAIYTTRKKDVESGIAQEATALANELATAADDCVKLADKDAEAYAMLQQTWKKDHSFTAEQVEEIQQTALNVPVSLLKLCHKHACAVDQFTAKCNPNIVSDAKVSIHLLAGAGRAAYQTVLVNQPNEALKQELGVLLKDLTTLESKQLPVD